MEIREISKADFQQFWPVFNDVIVAQETYAFDPELSFEQAYQLWCIMPEKTFVATEKAKVLGTYYLRPNSAGPSAHIANCGYMVSPDSRGKGVARKLCLHSQEIALSLGYTAMQFNAVVSTNTVAIKLWLDLGFNIVGTIPKAYRHKRLGLVDSHIMFKHLKLA